MRWEINLASLPAEGLELTSTGDGSYTIRLAPVPERPAGAQTANDASGMQTRPRGRFFLCGEPGRLGGAGWDGMRWLVMDVKGLSKADPAMAFEFWNGGNEEKRSDLTSIVGLLPGICVRVAFPLEAADGSRLFFIKRPPGRLKMVVHGNKVYMDACRKMAFGFYRINMEQHIELSNVHLTDEEPDYPQEQAVLLDEFGQWNGWDWPGKTTSALELTQRLHSRAALPDAKVPDGLSRFGGWKGKRFAASGFFRVEKADGRWWMADPEGYAFFSVGLDCLSLSAVQTELPSTAQWHKDLPAMEGPFAEAYYTGRDIGLPGGRPDFFCYDTANLIRAFGPDWKARGHKILKDYLLEWGFNTVGNWSSPEAIRSLGLPYVLPLEGFPDRCIDKKIFRDFPDVYGEQFALECERYATQLETRAADPLLIGYFMRNEPEWAFVEDICIAEELLENPENNDTKQEFLRRMEEKYAVISTFNKAWNVNLNSFAELLQPIRRARRLSMQAERDLNEFSRAMIDRYVRLPAQALRRADPNHLNLGMRYAYVDSMDLLAGCDVFDVFSVNCYQLAPREEMDRLGDMTGLPVMIGEYHFGALDRGLPATGLKAVATQADRGIAYRRYVESAAASPFCLGAHYFTWGDQSALGRFDGENYQIGAIDVCFRPYEEFIEGVKAAHARMYRVMAGEEKPFDGRAAEREIVAF